MKLDAITKGYGSINNKQRAALFFKYSTQGDQLEAFRIMSSVPRKSYTMNDAEFLKWTNGFSKLAGVFAQEHWIARHGLSDALLRINKFAQGKNANTHDLALALEDELYSIKLLLSLDVALLIVAEQHGFEVQCIYERARTKPYQTAKGELTADDELVAIWTDSFNMVVESSFG